MNKKIFDLEEKVKEMFSTTAWHTQKKVFKVYWVLHVKPVIDYCKILAKKYKANLEILWLAAIMHDIGYFYSDKKSHAKIGAEKAYKMLLEEGFNGKVAEKVRDTILPHSCIDPKPETIEEKILATADALSHFKLPYFLWRATVDEKSFKEQLASNLKKLERDWKRIFFKGEKELVRQEYQILKSWFEFHSKIEKEDL